jgi:hypothetical protein
MIKTSELTDEAPISSLVRWGVHGGEDAGHGGETLGEVRVEGNPPAGVAIGGTLGGFPGIVE